MNAIFFNSSKLLSRIAKGVFALVLVNGSFSAYAADEVKLLSNMNVPMTRYGIHWQNSQTKILVKNLAYEKKISVIFEGSEKPTRSFANYFGPASDGYEVWVAHSNVSGKDDYTFRIEYEVAGQTYLGDDDGQAFPLRVGPVLYNQQAIQQLNTGVNFYGNYAKITAALQSDLARAKTVTLHYGFDGEPQLRSRDLSFVAEYMYGYGFISSPSVNNSEIWQTSISEIPDDVSTITYTLSYEAEGTLYTDDNFGRGYTMNRYRE